MTNLTTIKIPNDSIIEDFKKHLDLEINERILFTAPFGAGKSTFINDFEAQYEEEYRFIRLYPVNYAVSANEDIFELIKFDILYELMAHHNAEINLVKEDFDFWLRMSMFMQNKADLMPLFLLILSQHEKIGKSAAVFIGALDKMLKPLKKGFKEYSEEIKKDELNDISKFLESFADKKGSPYEKDATSQFICDLVDRLKGEVLPNQDDVKEEDKKRVNKTVLVIDDLDRLDPDHIFRLFNIFSAHTHSISGENKFGFDKVIFVCDIQNIRKIYAHKYGQGVDFSGYMDKFYSVKPFEFNNFKYLQRKISDIINQSTFQSSSHQEIIKQDSVVCLLSAVLKILSKNRVINLRSLLKSNHFSLSIEGRRIISNNIHIKEREIPLFVVFQIISEMLGGWLHLKQALSSIKENLNTTVYFDTNQKFVDKYVLTNYDYGHEIDYLKEEVFKVFVVEHVKNEVRNTEGRKILQLSDFNLNIIYDLDYHDIASLGELFVKEIGGTITLNNHISYDLLLIEAFKKLQDYGFIPKN
ncbi:P-loop NTPase fold protein [Myroides marinus]|uniref:P-loop NTPase fold protein n=1 Tax=Myroides marinus TaxID=703342 RepID=UPI0025789365|nr:P-loop NTPase fold protein [Myroides marinus]MDM1378652.1 hypothetical protein [Myroides marinus]MDM1385923.1 hypothetical protein [Myroides marinus]MDM1393136.1 hypothetical protein [Myroides marinus]